MILTMSMMLMKMNTMSAMMMNATMKTSVTMTNTVRTTKNALMDTVMTRMPTLNLAAKHLIQ